MRRPAEYATINNTKNVQALRSRAAYRASPASAPMTKAKAAPTQPTTNAGMSGTSARLSDPGGSARTIWPE